MPKKKNPDTVPSPSPLLCINRNKHWKYISSYHGPWLQLPLELLESLRVLNLDPTTSLRPAQTRALPRDLAPTPPPIDPALFRSVATIRRLIDEAAELSVRASSGLSSAARASFGGAWPPAQTLALDAGRGRNVAMSAMRVHRLRALAVQKLAAAYKADEIASSVMVMQGGSLFDDIAERVLKHDPNDADAKYVHFFHEKIPSRANRQLAESTTTQVLDQLIASHPQRLEYYRTRGIVHCFRDEYSLATKDFTHALKEARAARKGRTAHRTIITLPLESRGKGGKKKKGSNNAHGQAPPNGTSPLLPQADCPDGVHPSASPDPPDPIEPQLLFLRGATYLQHALHLIESAILKLEGVSKASSTLDGSELRLCYLANGRYGGVEIGNPDGPLGKSDGPKARAYRAVLSQVDFRDDISAYLRKCIRDHERFLAHFDTLEGPPRDGPTDLYKRVEIAFLLSETARPSNHAASGLESSLPPMFTTYHPLLVESHFSILICQLMLAELPTLLNTFARTAVLVDGLEGYPVFLPPRSMAQAEFIEVLERLASGWKCGIQPHSAMRAGTGKRLAIQAPPPPVSPSNSLLDDMSSTSGETSALTSASKSRDLVESLNCARMLLVPVAARQRERASQAAAAAATDKTSVAKKKPLSINIPLHGPRVEIVLAWLAAVHLVELESVA